MSTLTEQIAEALYHSRNPIPPEWLVKYPHRIDAWTGWLAEEGDSFYHQDARAVAAVVADWLDGLADAHNDKIATIANSQRPRPLTYDTSHPDGTPAPANSGASSVLVAYGDAAARRLEVSGLAGTFVTLRTRVTT